MTPMKDEMPVIECSSVVVAISRLLDDPGTGTRMVTLNLQVPGEPWWAMYPFRSKAELDKMIDMLSKARNNLWKEQPSEADTPERQRNHPPG